MIHKSTEMGEAMLAVLAVLVVLVFLAIGPMIIGLFR